MYYLNFTFFKAIFCIINYLQGSMSVKSGISGLTTEMFIKKIKDNEISDINLADMLMTNNEIDYERILLYSIYHYRYFLTGVILTKNLDYIESDLLIDRKSMKEITGLDNYDIVYEMNKQCHIYYSEDRLIDLLKLQVGYFSNIISLRLISQKEYLFLFKTAFKECKINHVLILIRLRNDMEHIDDLLVDGLNDFMKEDYHNFYEKLYGNTSYKESDLEFLVNSKLYSNNTTHNPLNVALKSNLNVNAIYNIIEEGAILDLCLEIEDVIRTCIEYERWSVIHLISERYVETYINEPFMVDIICENMHKGQTIIRKIIATEELSKECVLKIYEKCNRNFCTSGIRAILGHKDIYLELIKYKYDVCPEEEEELLPTIDNKKINYYEDIHTDTE